MHALDLKLQDVILPVIDISILHQAYILFIIIPLSKLLVRQQLT
jgi:hypothetical protein